MTIVNPQSLYDHTISTQNREEQQNLIKYLDEHKVGYHVWNSLYLIVIKERDIYITKSMCMGYFKVHWQNEFNVISTVQSINILEKRKEQLLKDLEQTQKEINAFETEVTELFQVAS